MTPTRQRAIIFSLIGIGLLIVGFFGLRTIRALGKFRDHRPPPFAPEAESAPAETDVELIRDWMTIGYISHTYRTHPRLLYDTLGISPKGNEQKSLKELNDEFFPGVPDHVITIVKATIQANLLLSATKPPFPEVPVVPSAPPAAP